MCSREEKGSALAVTVATEACPDTEATRRYIYIYIYIHASGRRGPYGGLGRRELKGGANHPFKNKAVAFDQRPRPLHNRYTRIDNFICSI
jgi:hypothetical protein